MHEHARLITDFYSAFQRKDGKAMGACYHDEALFSDPVFPSLKASQVRAMWRMFCERPGTELSIEFSDVHADDDQGTAHWDASYRFRTGRRVLNRIDAAFRFKDGKIVRHTDTFDFWKWTRMAMGPAGTLFGWSSLFQNKIRGVAALGLAEFMATGKL